ncbi:sulfite exporter TauE/SafE family protein [Fluviibacterium sp. DFM31]|uniref:Probable membrane transporter protein n=1 Tax=Meridianimarinicoccus marinus TaxID=3231483 RepID=A0ABV3LBI6_9RHOB
MLIYLPIAETTVNLFHLVGLGIVVGSISGLFGVGGGFLLTPFLLIYGVPPQVAVASVAAQVVASSTSGALSHYRRRAVDPKLGAVLVGGGIVGSLTGVAAFDWLSRVGQLDAMIGIGYLTLLGSIGTIMLVETTRFILRGNRTQPTARRLKRRGWIEAMPLKVRFRVSGLYMSVFKVLLVGYMIGLIGALLGIGGGFILVPALLYVLRMPSKYLVGTSLLHLTAVMAVTCYLHAWRSGSVDILLAFCLMIGSVAGAQIGTTFGRRLPAEQLRLLLALIVLAVAARFAVGLFLYPGNLFETVEIPARLLP